MAIVLIVRQFILIAQIRIIPALVSLDLLDFRLDGRLGLIFHLVLEVCLELCFYLFNLLL
jgi:hypothetical protein